MALWSIITSTAVLTIIILLVIFSGMKFKTKLLIMLAATILCGPGALMAVSEGLSIIAIVLRWLADFLNILGI